MNIGTRQHLATAAAFAAIGLIAAVIFWADAQVRDAKRQRVQTTAIARGYSELRLVTFDYLLHRQERARAQWHAASDRIDRLIADNHFSQPEHQEILAGLRARRAAAPRLFEQLDAVSVAGLGPVAGDTSRLRFEAQLLSRLLVDQQDGLADAFRLTAIANERIDHAQRRVVVVIAAGLILIALITATGSWLMHRRVLVPIAGLQRATLEVASGNLSGEPDLRRDDEIGALWCNFGAMTASLRASFARLERGNQELAALNTELDAYSYSVSHDLRAPLRSMDGFSKALIEDYGDKLDEEGRDALERIRAASRRMGDLIDDLLRLSRATRTPLDLTQVDLSAIAQEIADTLHRDGAGRRVQWAIEPGLSVRADAALLRIAMQNLLANAWKFTARSESPVIRVGALDRGGKNVYFVADNGTGFDMARAERLFGAFQRLHLESDFPGTGIGLAIVQRIIRRHGGEIRAEATPGAGATFFFSVADTEPGSHE